MRLLCLLFYISISCFSFASEKKVANTAVDTAKVAIGTNVKTRLGNGLTSYINCKYLSYKYNVPFLYQPFPYSDQFSFHDKELSRAIWEPLFKNNKQFEGVEDFNLRSTFLVVPFFRDGPLAHRWKLRLYPDLKDPVFLNIVREMLQPRLDFETLELPKNKVNVVLHVRRGGDFDNQQTIQRLPFEC